MDNEEDKRIFDLKQAIREGIESGRAENFDPVKHIEVLKAARKQSN